MHSLESDDGATKKILIADDEVGERVTHLGAVVVAGQRAAGHELKLVDLLAGNLFHKTAIGRARADRERALVHRALHEVRGGHALGNKALRFGDGE